MKKQLVKIISLFSVLVLLCCPLLHPAVTAVSESKEVVASKVDEKVLSAFDDGAKTVKVYVWLNDIDQKQVDKIVEQKTGLCADNLAVIDENISNELATRIVSEADRDSLTTETEKLLQAYLDRTAAQRTQERERTDLYTSTRRAEAKAKYNEKSAAFLSQTSISSEKVIFNSNYAPMLILDLTKQEVNALAKREDVENIVIFEEKTVMSTCEYLDNKFDNCEITRIKSVSGLSGQGVAIGNVDNYAPDPNDSYIVQYFGSRVHYMDGYKAPLSSHASRVCMIHSSIEGIAHSAHVYATGLAATAYVEDTHEFPISEYYRKIEDLISIDVDVINISCGSEMDLPYYTMNCKWIDHIVSTHSISVVVAAGNCFLSNGNISYNVIDPALASNVITVGSYHEVFDITQGDITNTLADYSCYVEGATAQKPDVLGLGYYGSAEWTGTSFAAPFVTGIIALILELRPHLSTSPQLIKAIIMASCHEKAQDANNQDNQDEMIHGITNKQGVGIVNPYIAISIASHGTYGMGELTQAKLSQDVKIKQPTSDIQGINISLTWLQENLIFGDHNTGSVTLSGELQDLSLQLINEDLDYGRTYTIVSSTETLYCSLYPIYSDNYTIRISADEIPYSTKYAYAWSVENSRFQYSDNGEGIGYLKNANSMAYLQANANTLSIAQNSNFDGDFDQMWIINKTGQAQHTLFSAYESIGGIACYSNLNAYISNSDENLSHFTITSYKDGTFSFRTTINDEYYYLGVINDSTSTGAQVAWILNSGSVTASQKWYFEPCAYLHGDIDLDGAILAADSRYILRAASGSETPNTLQAYLCDIDCNGTISAADSRLALRYSTGLD